MPRRLESLFLAGPAGRLEALLEEPEAGPPCAAALVCHPHPLYGGTMHNKVVYRIARGLRRAGFAVLRFNFRGVGQSEGEHAHLTGEIEDARSAAEWLRGRYPALPLTLAGFSFGSQVIAHLGCETGAALLIVVGFPVRPGDSSYLENCPVPKVFLQSTGDQYGPPEGLNELFARVSEPKRLVWIPAADHFFAGALEVLEEKINQAVSG